MDTPQGFIYLIQDGRYRNTDVYKIGRATQEGDTRRFNRFNAYDKGTRVFFITDVNHENVSFIEAAIISLFNTKYHLVRGREWFRGDVKAMKADIYNMICAFGEVRTTTNNPNVTAVTCGTCNMNVCRCLRVVPEQVAVSPICEQTHDVREQVPDVPIPEQVPVTFEQEPVATIPEQTDVVPDQEPDVSIPEQAVLLDIPRPHDWKDTYKYKWPYEQFKVFWEMNFFKLEGENVYCELYEGLFDNNIIVRRKGQMLSLYPYILYHPGTTNKRTKFVSRWLSDIDIKTFRAINFMPPGCPDKPGVFNVWRGFEAELSDLTTEGIRMFNEQVMPTIAALFNNDHDSIEYFLDWLAHMVQTPGIKLPIAYVLTGRCAANKKLLVTLVKNLLGRSLIYRSEERIDRLLQLDNKDKMIRNTSNDRFGRIFVCIDKREAADHDNEYNHLVKLINQQQMTYYSHIRSHNDLTYTVNSLERYIYLVNNQNHLRVPETDKYCVVQPICEQQIEHPDAIDRPDVQRAFYEFLKDRDITARTDWQETRPKNQYMYEEHDEIGTWIHQNTLVGTPRDEITVETLRKRWNDTKVGPFFSSSQMMLKRIKKTKYVLIQNRKKIWCIQGYTLKELPKKEEESSTDDKIIQENDEELDE